MISSFVAHDASFFIDLGLGMLSFSFVFEAINNYLNKNELRPHWRKFRNFLSVAVGYSFNSLRMLSALFFFIGIYKEY
jgi:hypothetical protein